MTLKEFSEKINISSSTISRVLNNRPGISKQTRRLVMDAVEREGFKTSYTPRKKENKKFHFVGIVARKRGNEQDDIFFQNAIHSCQSEFNKHSLVSIPLGYVDQKVDFDNSPIKPSEFGGFIFRGQSIPADVIESFEKYSVPIVLLENHIPSRKFNSIVANDMELEMLVTKHLLEKGYDRIVHLSGPKDWYDNNQRMAGYTQAMQQAGKKPWIINMEDGTLKTGALAYHMLSKESAGLGVTFTNDAMAIGFLNAANNDGRNIPGDFGIAGFDDIPWTSFSNPMMTTAHVETSEMAKMAARRLIQLMEGTDSCRAKIEVPGRLIVRKSC
jgi:LacI family transcriptional regulator